MGDVPAFESGGDVTAVETIRDRLQSVGARACRMLLGNDCRSKLVFGKYIKHTAHAEQHASHRYDGASKNCSWPKGPQVTDVERLGVRSVIGIFVRTEYLFGITLLAAAPATGQQGLPKPPAGYVWEPRQELTDEFNGRGLDTAKWMPQHAYVLLPLTIAYLNRVVVPVEAWLRDDLGLNRSGLMRSSEENTNEIYDQLV